MRLRPGQVRDAITSYLASRGAKGATTIEIYTAVVDTLGQQVATSSIRSYLNLNTPSRFERVSRGHYRLKKGARV